MKLNSSYLPHFSISAWLGEDLIVCTHTGDVLLFQSQQFYSVVWGPENHQDGLGNGITSIHIIDMVTL